MQDLVKIKEDIQNKIYTIRLVQVMLDEDLAKLYKVETKVFNQAVSRNLKRFPENFRFQLTKDEYEYILRSQIVTSRLTKHGWRRFLPYVFTEQGVSMLSAILKSDIAIEISIKIIEAFVQMRKILHQNAYLFQKIENIEWKILEHDKKFAEIFKIIDSNNIKPIQWIFYNWQIYDAYIFVNDLFKSSKKEVILIDNYIDDTVLTLFSKYPKLRFNIITNNISKQLQLDIDKYNSQYKNLEIKISKRFHDRFLIIDNKETYNIWSSLKDLWKKIFWFSKIDFKLLEKVLEE